MSKLIMSMVGLLMYVRYVLKDCGALRDRNVVHLVDRRDAPGKGWTCLGGMV